MDRRHVMSLAALAAATSLVLAWDIAAAAAAEVDIGAQVRWRPESERVLVRPGGTSRIEALQLLRTRVTAQFEPGARTTARVQFQDARVMGVPPSGGVSGDSNLGVQEAYLQIGDFFSSDLMLRAGRFELNYGNQRLLGGVGWSNTGRTFDAVRLTVMQPAWKLDILGAKRVERQSGPNDDTNVYGAYARFEEANVDAFILFDYDGRKAGPEADRMLQRWTAGAYSARSLGGGNVDYIANVAYQFGNFFSAADTASVDIGAYLVAVEVGYTRQGSSKVRVAGGIDLASGNDPTSDTFGAFNNLYYTGHKFRGYMDQFLASNPEGLMDIHGRASVETDADWGLGADFHVFRTAQDFASATDGTETKSVGFELDTYVKTTRLEHAAVQLGGTAFVPSEEFAGAEHDTEFWGYLQVTVNLN